MAEAVLASAVAMRIKPLLVFSGALLVFTTLLLALTRIPYSSRTHLSCYLLANSTALKIGDVVTLQCNSEIAGREVVLEPPGIFSLIDRRAPDKVAFIYHGRESAGEYPLLGKLRVYEHGYKAWEGVLLLEESEEYPAKLQFEGMLIKVFKDFDRVRVWYWSIRVPFDLKKKVFVVPTSWTTRERKASSSSGDL